MKYFLIRIFSLSGIKANISDGDDKVIVFFLQRLYFKEMINNSVSNTFVDKKIFYSDRCIICPEVSCCKFLIS